MKAAVYYENGGPEVFRYEEVPLPVCHPGEVLIKIKSISIEGGDSINREIRPLFNIPNIVGYQCAGEIVFVGAQVTDREIGQRVVAISRYGSHAEFIAVESWRSFILPDDLPFDIGSAIPTAFFTAHECLFTFGHLQAGQSVLIHGGSGALGLAAIQLAKLAGVTVLTTGSDDEKLEKLKGLGADYTINYKTEEFDQAVNRITKGKGVNLVVDSVGGGKNLSKSVKSLSYGGIISFVGFSGRDASAFDIIELWPKNATITGIYTPSSMDHERDRFRSVLEKIILEVAERKLKVIIAKTFPLSQVREAYEYILDKNAFGRVLLLP